MSATYTKATVEVTGVLRGKRIFRTIDVRWNAARGVEQGFIPAREGVPAQHRIFYRHPHGIAPLLITRFISR